MKNHPYLDQPLRSEAEYVAEVKAEAANEADSQIGETIIAVELGSIKARLQHYITKHKTVKIWDES